MRVLLLKDVYKLGRAGDIKKVADGYGRNFLMPQGLAIPATAGSVKLAETIGKKAAEQRAVLNKELEGVATLLNGLVVEFSMKAGETGKLYGSVTSQMVADKVKELKGIELERRDLVMEPIRVTGEHEVPVHLTLDLVPALNVIVRREGEAVKPKPVVEEMVEAEEELEAVVEEIYQVVEEVIEELELEEEAES